MIRRRTVRTVASFELWSTVKRKGYLIATFGMPVFVLLYGGLISLIGLFAAKQESEVKIYGVVDQAQVLKLREETEVPSEIRKALEAAGQQPALDHALGWWKNFVFRPYDDVDAARAALLGDRIRGFFVIPADYLETGAVETYARENVDFQGSDSKGALRSLLLDRLLEGRVSGEVADRVRKPIAKSTEWTVTAAGTVEERHVFAVIAKLVVPIVFAILLLISLMMSAGYLMQGTAAEKENKVVEILLCSASPDEILAGKLLGLGGAGLLQVVVWFGMVIFAGLTSISVLGLAGVDVPWEALLVAVPFFLIGYLFLGSLMLGTGSLGSNVKESQQFGMVWAFLMMVPMVCLQILITEPNGTLARVLTWIPFTSPVTVVLRTTLGSAGIAWWEIAGAFVVMVLSTWIALRFGARLFRVGLLLTGSRPKLREILRQARLSG